MAGTLTIREVDDSIRQALQRQAHLHNRSVEEEARHIIAAALARVQPEGFGDQLAAIGRKHGVTAQDLAQLEAVRERHPAQPMDVA